MAQSDIYCPICGAALSIPLFRASDGRVGTSAGSDRPTDEDMQWLKNVRILYRSYVSQLKERVFLSSLLVRRDDGQYRETEDLLPDDFDNPEPVILRTFDPTRLRGGVSYCIPLHDACNNLLVKFLDYTVGIYRSIYIDVLHETLRSFRYIPVYPGRIKVGQIAKQQGQFWYPTLDTKAFVYDPFFITPALKNYYDNLPVVEPGGDHMSESGVFCTNAVWSRDPFSKLPAELLMMILIHLPARSIANLSLASVVIARAQLPGGFWKQKLKRDMPWLWDFPYHRNEQNPRSLDWLQIYKDIYVGSKSYDKSRFLNLANRRRVWRICEQIAPRFAEYQESKEFTEKRGIRELL